MKGSNRAFTLIELLVVIAIIAILAAILFPVFAQAKAAAKKTSSLSGLKQVSLGLNIYATDNDDFTPNEYGYSTDPANTNQYHFNTTWVGKIFPYVKNQAIFFDKTYAEISDYNRLYQDPYYPDPFYTYSWAWITTFSMNTDGYSRQTASNSRSGWCAGTANGSASNVRSLSSIESIADRLAVTPTRYGSIANWSWMRFLTIQAATPVADRYANTFSWNQLVFDARRQYNTRFIGAFADGHAANFGPEKFVKRYADNPSRDEWTNRASLCAAFDARNLWNFWGEPWSAN